VQDWEHLLGTQQYAKGTSNYDSLLNSINNYKEQIKTIESGIQVQIPNNIAFSAQCDDRKAVICYFKDSRLANINEAKTASGIETEQETALQSYNQNRMNQQQQSIFGARLEQHLVNPATRRQWALARDNDKVKAAEIDSWFAHFEAQLKKLFEDDSVHLEINSDTLKYTIVQNSKPPYTFQTLSAGYKAIFDIYAELLMRTEYFIISPDKLEGAVFIDELDSHLHISLQRLILPFFVESFPQIQFIVTTHSPFVISSSENALVYDLERPERGALDNMSAYSYDAIVEYYYSTDKYSGKIRQDFEEYQRLLNKTERTEDDNERFVDLITKLSSIPTAAAPELVNAFRALELKRRSEASHGKN
jgi:AAA15 family ATPase/GTPase